VGGADGAGGVAALGVLQRGRRWGGDDRAVDRGRPRGDATAEQLAAERVGGGKVIAIADARCRGSAGGGPGMVGGTLGDGAVPLQQDGDGGTASWSLASAGGASGCEVRGCRRGGDRASPERGLAAHALCLRGAGRGRRR